MQGMQDAMRVLTDHIRDPSTSWSIGTFGAIAEFVRDSDEPAQVECSARTIAVCTGRGGIRIGGERGLKLVASEGVTKESWSQQVALCLPRDASAKHRRTVLTELGQDKEALRSDDHDGVLFDLGVNAHQVDACIRVADPSVAATLREYCGRSIFEPGNPAMGVILASNPHRVFVSRLGRAEVFQAIPPSNGKSPDGPHTHVLPKLLQSAQTHSANEPIPAGWVPCAHFYPAHPIKDASGSAIAFSPTRHEAFQELFRSYGPPDLVALKAKLIDAVAAGDDPMGLLAPSSRFARTAVRVCVRQLEAAGTAVLSQPGMHGTAGLRAKTPKVSVTAARLLMGEERKT